MKLTRARPLIFARTKTLRVVGSSGCTSAYPTEKQGGNDGLSSNVPAHDRLLGSDLNLPDCLARLRATRSHASLQRRRYTPFVRSCKLGLSRRVIQAHEGGCAVRPIVTIALVRHTRSLALAPRSAGKAKARSKPSPAPRSSPAPGCFFTSSLSKLIQCRGKTLEFKSFFGTSPANWRRTHVAAIRRQRSGGNAEVRPNTHPRSKQWQVSIQVRAKAETSTATST